MPKNWTGEGRSKAGRKGAMATNEKLSKRRRRKRSANGGVARAVALSPERRSEIARAAAAERHARPTLVLHDRHDEDSQLLWQAAVNAKWPVERLDLGWDDDDITELRGKRRLAIYGGYMFGERLAERLGLTLLGPADLWMVEAAYEVMKRAIHARRAELRPAAYPIFVKPARGKPFDSRVYYSRGDLDSALASVDGEELVIWQEPVDWREEYRCWVLGDEVVTASLYGRDGMLVEAEEMRDALVLKAVEFLESVIGRLPALPELPKACVIDVGVIEGRGWAVVEANPAWCSGIYGCDPREVLRCVRAATENDDHQHLKARHGKKEQA